MKYHLANIADKLGVRGQDLRQWPGIPASSPLIAERKDRSMPAASTIALGPIGQVSLSIRDVARCG